ncbi:hypothetical protein [Dyella sp. 2RAB6]|uniref:hypothetical protein n=1 Tax=Dyella sp. 2RAB6 TaxID=3232992 RepID=UPI003F8E317F
MIIWGSGGKQIDLGVAEHKDCAVCEKQRPYRLLLQYRYGHLYYLFKWVSKKSYVLACEVCHRGWQLEPKAIEAKLEKNPIPFGDRFGWVGLFVIFGVIMLAAALSSPR